MLAGGGGARAVPRAPRQPRAAVAGGAPRLPSMPLCRRATGLRAVAAAATASDLPPAWLLGAGGSPGFGLPPASGEGGGGGFSMAAAAAAGEVGACNEGPSSKEAAAALRLDSLGRLVAALSAADPHQQAAAAKALGDAAAGSASRRAEVVAAGALSPLVRLLESGDAASEACAAAARALGILARGGGEPQARIFEAGAAPALVQQLLPALPGNGAAAAATAAARALAHLAADCSADQKATLLAAGALPALSSALASADSGVGGGEAARALAELLRGDAGARAKAVAAGVVQAVLSVLGSAAAGAAGPVPTPTARYAARVLAVLMAGSPADGAPSSGMPNDMSAVVARAAVLEGDGGGGGGGGLRGLLALLEPPQAPAAAAAVEALCGLALAPGAGGALVKAGGLAPLVRALASPNPAASEGAATALARLGLAKDPELVAAAAQAGLVHGLAAMLRARLDFVVSESDAALIQACQILSSLLDAPATPPYAAATAELRAQFVESGAVAQAVRVLSLTGDPAVPQEAASLVKLAAASPDERLRAAVAAELPSLIARLGSAAPAEARPAASALWWMADSSGGDKLAALLVEAGAATALVQLIKGAAVGGNPYAAASAASILSDLVVCEAGAAAAAAAGALPALATAAGFEEEVCWAVPDAVRALVAGAGAGAGARREQARASGVVEALELMAGRQDLSDDVIESAVAALRALGVEAERPPPAALLLPGLDLSGGL
jgi:hypothetical protein